MFNRFGFSIKKIKSFTFDIGESYFPSDNKKKSELEFSSSQQIIFLSSDVITLPSEIQLQYSNDKKERKIIDSIGWYKFEIIIHSYKKENPPLGELIFNKGFIDPEGEYESIQESFTARILLEEKTFDKIYNQLIFNPDQFQSINFGAKYEDKENKKLIEDQWNASKFKSLPIEDFNVVFHNNIKNVSDNN